MELPDGTRMEVFGSGGGQAVADSLSTALGAPVPLLGQVPLETRLRECGDGGTPIVLAEPDSPGRHRAAPHRRPARRAGPRPGRAQPQHHARPDRGGPAPTSSAVELLAAYRADRTLSPVEATAAVLARIARLDPRVNAFCLVDEAAALAAARASEDRWARGEPCGRARRRAGVDQGPAAHPRLADAARLALDRPGRAVGRRRARRSPACASTAACSSARRPRPSWAGRASPTAPLHRGHRATRGTRRARPAARAAAARRPSRWAWRRSRWAPTAAARCASRRPSAASPRSSRRGVGCRSTRRARSGRCRTSGR